MAAVVTEAAALIEAQSATIARLNAEVERMRATMGGARAALQSLLDTWLDYHDSHSLTEAVTGRSGNAFDVGLEARDSLDAALAPKEG